jgi:hypothetical protein
MPCTCLADVARFTPLDPDLDLDRVEAAVRTETDAVHKARGWRRCHSCGSRPHPDDMDWFFKHRLCTSCAMRLVDELLFKAAKRHGRKKALKLLKRLSK